LAVRYAGRNNLLLLGTVFVALFWGSPSFAGTTGTVLLGSQSIANQVDSGGVGQAEAFPTAATASNTLSSLTGSVNVGSTSAPQAVASSNTGTGSLTISHPAIFSIGGLPLPLTLAGGQSTSFSVTFAPTNRRPHYGQLSVTPASLSFGGVNVGSTSAPQTVTLSNGGKASVTISQATVTGTGFGISGLSVPLTLAGGQSTGFSVSFAPTAGGSATGSVTVTSNASTSPSTIGLSGTGVMPQLSATPASLSFGSVNVGSTSAPQTVTLSNAGAASVTISQATVTGTGFSISGLSLPLAVAGGKGTSFSVTFAPTKAGSATGSISVLSNASNSPASVTLSGTGNGAQLAATPTSTNFGHVLVGNNGVLPVTLQNTGTSSLTISQANVAGAGFSISGPSIPLTLTTGQSTSFSVTFAPTATGSVTGSISLLSSALNSPTSESLSGTGVNSHSTILSWTASTSTNVAGYNIYCATVSGGPYTELNPSLVSGTSYTDNTPQAGHL
jgi:hypothetical protein